MNGGSFPPVGGAYPNSSYGYGGYSPYVGGYGYGPYNSMPNTPYETLKSELYDVKDGTRGLTTGAPIGAGLGFLGGAATAALVGTKVGALGGVPGMLAGGLIGGVIGLFAGGAGGKKLAEFQGTLHDAKDDGRLNGSPLDAEHGSGGAYYMPPFSQVF